MKTFLSAFASLLLCASASGCAEEDPLLLQPGQYSYYQVTLQPVGFEGCPLEMIENRTRADTFLIYVTDGSRVFLQTEDRAIEGSKNDESATYTFSESSEVISDTEAGVVRTVTEVLIELESVDASLFGSHIVTTTVECSGACVGFQEYSCAAEFSVAGVGIDAHPEP